MFPVCAFAKTGLLSQRPGPFLSPRKAPGLLPWDSATSSPPEVLLSISDFSRPLPGVIHK